MVAMKEGENDGSAHQQGHSNLSIDELLPSNYNKSVSVSPDIYKDADHPSLISVLELSSKESNTISESFKQISANLQELRTQIQFLILDSTNSFTKEIKAFISFDDDSVEPLGDMLQAFRDEKERDFVPFSTCSSIPESLNTRKSSFAVSLNSQFL